MPAPSSALVIGGVCGVRVVLGINLSQYSNLQLLYTGTIFKVRVLRQFFSEEGLQHLTCLNVLLSTGKKVTLRPRGALAIAPRTVVSLDLTGLSGHCTGDLGFAEKGVSASA